MPFAPSSREQREGQYELAVTSAARTTSGNSSAIIAGSALESITVFSDVTAASGTSPSLTVSLEVSPDGGTTWYNCKSLTAQTAVSKQKASCSVYVNDSLTDVYRIAWAITGTTPSFTFSVRTYATRN